MATPVTRASPRVLTIEGVQSRDTARHAQGSSCYSGWEGAGSDQDDQSSHPLQGRAFFPIDQAAVWLSKGPAAWPGQEPLQDQCAGSAVESVPGPTTITRDSLIRGMVCLKTLI